MTCTNCAASIKRFLERKGMEEVVVDFASDSVYFEMVENDEALDKVKAGIHKLGFEVLENEDETSQKWWTLERKVWISAVFTLPLLMGHILMAIHFNSTLTVWLAKTHWMQLVLCLPVFLIGIAHFGRSAWSSTKTGVPNMDVLIFLGSTAAFIYSLVGLFMNEANYIFFETSATIITLVLVGNLLEKRAVSRTTAAVEELARLQPRKANRIKTDGSIETVDLQMVHVGDVLQINEGDSIPTDGSIEYGEVLVDESMLTGESLPVLRRVGEGVVGGSIVVNGNCQFRVNATGKKAVLGQIIELVKKAQLEKPGLQRLADRISAVFVPVVVGLALLTFILAYFVFQISLTQAIMNSIAVLVISCPCALGLATPTAVTVGVGLLAKAGVLVKGAQTMETFENIKRFVFDKTGTLTTGDFAVKKVNYHHQDKEWVNALIYQLEKHSNHPIARSLIKSLGNNGSQLLLENIEEIRGVGVRGRMLDSGLEVGLGSSAIAPEVTSGLSHDLYLTSDKQLLATVDIADEIRSDAAEMVRYLNNNHLETVLLSGDREQKTAEVARNLGIDIYFAGHRPEDKLKKITELSNDKPTAMIGDGINDAPALARADLGISISGGTKVAIQSAQIILLNGKLSQLPKAIEISKKTVRTIKQNLFWAFAYNVVAIPIAAVGLLNPMWAAFFMAFSDIVVIGNSLLLYWKNKPSLQ